MSVARADRVTITGIENPLLSHGGLLRDLATISWTAVFLGGCYTYTRRLTIIAMVGDTMKLAEGACSCARVFLSIAILAAVSVNALAQKEDNPDVAKLNAISEADTMVTVPLRDGVGLAADFCLLKSEGRFPVIFVKTPNNFNKISGGRLDWAIDVIERGYAFETIKRNTV